MDLYGLLGYPLCHSFSARYFAGKFSRERIDAEYRNFEYATVDEAMACFSALPALRGFNVTIPHKQTVMEWLDDLSPEARAIGAVNVVRVERVAGAARPRLVGYNSDVVGFVRSLRPLLRPCHTAALVLGTGGASKAVTHGLRLLGIGPVSVSRSPAPGRLTYRDLTPEVVQGHRLIVNCTPVGTFPHDGECPDIPYGLLSSDHLLYDLVYNPEETLFMKRGRESGAAVKNGLEMLRLQAEAAWSIWQGEAVPAVREDL